MKFTFLLFLLLSSLCFAGTVERLKLISPKGIAKGDCSPCALKDKSGSIYSLETIIEKTKKRQTPFIVGLKINGRSFQIESDTEMHKNIFVPFYEVDLEVGNNLKMFALQSEATASNLYFHYFLKEGDDFFYIGQYPSLSYSSKGNYFQSKEKTGMNHEIKKFKLEKKNKKLKEL